MDLQAILSQVITSTNEIFEAEAGSVALLENSGQKIVIRAAVGAGAELVRGLSMPVNEGVIGWVASNEKPAMIANVENDERFYNGIDEQIGFHTRSIMCVPMQVDGHTIGAIELMNMNPDYLSDNGLKIFRVIADHAALAIENSHLYNEATNHLAEAKLLQEVMVTAASTLDFDQILSDTIKALHRTLGIEQLGFLIPTEDGNSIIPHPTTIGLNLEGGNFHIPMDGSAAGWVIRNGKPLLIPDVKQANYYYELVATTKTEVCVPVMLNDTVAAVLNIESPRLNAFDQEDLRLFVAIAAELTIALKNARLFEEIQAAKANYYDLFNNANDLIFSLNSNLRISRANKAVLNSTGYTLAEIINAPATKFIQKKNIAHFYKLLKIRLSSTKSPSAVELPVLGKDKQELMLEIAIQIRREGNRPVSIDCIARDITQRQILERQLQQTEKLSAIGKLVAGVAHELNNPLTTIIGYASMLQNATIPNIYQEDLDIIVQQTKRAGTIVRNLLNFAREFELETAMVDINEIINSSLSLTKPQLQTQSIQVVTSLDFGLPQTVADPHRLEQVFVNLILNAVQALSNIKRPRRLSISSKSTDGFIRLCFIDNGTGIPSNIIDHIFDPFFTTKKVGEGTGLGLSICFGIISEHKGHIRAKNNSDGGAAFYIKLPIKVPPISQTAMPLLPQPIIKTALKLHILVIDDEPSLLKLLERILNKSGHKVDTAPNGTTALQKVERNSYDIIICDVLMPDITGLELYTQLSKKVPGIADRFIFITGNVVDIDTSQFLKKSGLPWLSKPFLPVDINKIIQQTAIKIMPNTGA